MRNGSVGGGVDKWPLGRVIRDDRGVPVPPLSRFIHPYPDMFMDAS